MSTTAKSEVRLPYLTAGLPGIGGVFKESAEDFVVSELPLYPPSGSGEHLYLLVEKQGITTLEMIRRLARAVRVAERDIGYAGMKDARGITRQTVSIPGIAPEQATGLELPGIKILAASRHNNKLRLGHLAGNAFRIRIRNTPPDADVRAAAVLDILAAKGLPNYFGSQRYGAMGNSATIGCKLLQGDAEGAIRALMGEPENVDDQRWQRAIDAFRVGDHEGALALLPPHCRTEREVVRTLLRRPDNWEAAIKSIHPRMVNLYLSAAQSALFDDIVATRIAALDRVEEGDVAYKHDNGACFLVTDAAEASRRAADFEISATGPMFGRKMLAPAGKAAAMEEEILAASGLSREDFATAGRFRLDGERRPLRVPLREIAVGSEADLLQLEFTLPKGAYATSVLREIMK